MHKYGQKEKAALEAKCRLVLEEARDRHDGAYETIVKVGTGLLDMKIVIDCQVVTGKWGRLTIWTNGSWSYRPAPGDHLGKVDKFVYRTSHGRTATLEIAAW